MHHGSWHLYGHSHGSLPEPTNKSMDVGCMLNNYIPYEFEDIKNIMSTRVFESVDHHK